MSAMNKPICLKCNRIFRVKKSGIAFIEGMPKESGAKPGWAEPGKWQPYKLWMADKLECPGCGAQVLYGFGQQPVSEHYLPEFKSMVDKFGATLQVNDC